MRWFMLLMIGSVLSANPILVEVINEFQVAPYDSERVELRYLQSEALDTVFTEIFDLYNTEVMTPAGMAYVDTNMFLSGMGQTVIDRSVLTGIFGLPDDTGFARVSFVVGFIDSIFYPRQETVGGATTPPSQYSAAKFHCYACDTVYEEYFYLVCDWYLDSTPTFGASNDDYPGCRISGYVFGDNNQPLSSARVTVTMPQNYPFWHYVFSTPYYTCCTTYTSANGAYAFDSLLPWWYWVDVYADGYQPDTQSIGRLYYSNPITDLDFYLQTGIEENREYDARTRSFVRPNPFRSVLHIAMREPSKNVNIYDVTGKLVRQIDNQNLSTNLTVDCTDLPRGLYFVALKEQRLKVIKL